MAAPLEVFIQEEIPDLRCEAGFVLGQRAFQNVRELQVLVVREQGWHQRQWDFRLYEGHSRWQGKSSKVLCPRLLSDSILVCSDKSVLRIDYLWEAFLWEVWIENSIKWLYECFPRFQLVQSPKELGTGRFPRVTDQKFHPSTTRFISHTYAHILPMIILRQIQHSTSVLIPSAEQSSISRPMFLSFLTASISRRDHAFW